MFERYTKQKNLPSTLPAAVRRFLGAALVLAAFMLANSAYLVLNRAADALGLGTLAASDHSLPVSFQVLLLSHTGAGLLLAVLMLAFMGMHLPKVWRRYNRASGISGILYVVAGLVLSATGLFILTEAASESNRWAWWLHVGCGLIAVIGYAVHRVVSYRRPVSAQVKRFWFGSIGLVLLFAAVHTVEKLGAPPSDDRVPNPAASSTTHEAGLRPGFTPSGFVSPESRFFPSPATTSSGSTIEGSLLTDVADSKVFREDLERVGFVVSQELGAAQCVRCHPDVTAQWASSAHRFSSFNNPFYEASIRETQTPASPIHPDLADHPAVRRDSDSSGRIKSQWCAGCHDPLPLFTGTLAAGIDRRTAEAQSGLTCLACHTIGAIHNRTGNGNYEIEDERRDAYLFAGAEPGGVAGWLHDAALKARPATHKRRMLKPFFRTSEFCATCHKVSLPPAVNNYRWLRGQNEFDAWHDSGVSLNASRTFYLPPRARRCQNCHMPLERAVRGDLAAKNGFVRSHRFPAANTALPFIRGDSTMLAQTEAFLQNDILGLDIFALSQGGRQHTALDKQPPTIAPGEPVQVDVVVRNRNVGHTFPGGTNDSNEGWIEFTVFDADKGELVKSGFLNADGQLDSMAHVYKAVLLDREGNAIQRRNAQDIHVPVFANVIGPGTADIAHYHFTLPKSYAGNAVTLQARLLWRKFDRPFTEFAWRTNRDGFKAFQRPPDLPVTVIAEQEIVLPVGHEAPTEATAATPEDWMRFNDYGIGLLLEDDTRGARAAFAQVRDLRPDFLEGWLNLAKTAVRDGNLDSAYVYLKQCEALRPADARVAWVWGLALQEEGQFEKAAAAWRHVLESFPGDRAALRNLGRTLFLDKQYAEALSAFDRVLEIDPEDRIAHYHRMLTFRAQGDSTSAKSAEAAYAYYQIDESAQALTTAFRARHPGVNLMSQKVRVHNLRIHAPPR